MIGNRQKRFPIFNMLLRISEKSYNFAADFRKWYLRLFFSPVLFFVLFDFCEHYPVHKTALLKI